ncbi:MAG: hypothetical protein OQK32_00895 [Gammaproteobacteria bacterium]|nr:hypothetical protein [Gammaproteobacteria bacterium]MCW8922092.1 hypothetical protein [Gammaproteobacteria bacterium]
MKILVIRNGRVGDTVMATSAITALLNLYPDAKITIIASPEGSRLLKGFHERVEAIWVWSRYGLGFKSRHVKKKLIKKIEEAKFDMAFCLDTNPSIASLLDACQGEKYFQTHLGPPTHCARHYLNLIEQASGQKINDIPVNLPVPDDAIAQLGDELKKIGIEKDDTVIMMHPTFSGYSRLGLRKRKARKRKLWPAQNYAELAEKLLSSDFSKNHRIKIIMALLPAEKSLGNKIVKLSNNKIQLIESVPSFERYKALIHRANLFVSPDTGPMHIAAAVNTRTVAMFSNKDPADCGPYMSSDRFNILRSECTEQPGLGIAAISVNAMLSACEEQLEKIETEKTGKGVQ